MRSSAARISIICLSTCWRFSSANGVAWVFANILNPLFRKFIKLVLESSHVPREMHPIDHAMIATESQVNGVVDVQAAVDDHRALFRRANRQNSYLRRTNDGDEAFDLFHDAEIADRKRATLQIVGFEPFFACSFDQG